MNKIDTKKEKESFLETYLNDFDAVNHYMSNIIDKRFTEAQKQEFLYLCSEYKLNPLKNEIYAVAYKNKKTGEITLTPITSYKVYLKRAAPFIYSLKVEFEKIEKDGKLLDVEATCTIVRKGTDNKPLGDYVHSVRLTEYDKSNMFNDFWKSKKRTMLRKVLISQAIRECFADVIDLPYVHEEIIKENKEVKEMNRAGNVTLQGHSLLLLQEVMQEHNCSIKNAQNLIDNAIKKEGTYIKSIEDIEIVRNKLLTKKELTKKEITEDE